MRGVECRREFICTDNCSVRLNYFPLQFSVLPLALSPSSLFNSIYLAFSLSFRERRAIIGSSTPRNHGGRAKKFVCYSWKQLRKRRYSKRLHSNLITSVLRRGRPAVPARRGAARISHAFYILYNFDVISFVSAETAFVPALKITDTGLNRDRFCSHVVAQPRVVAASRFSRRANLTLHTIFFILTQ